MHAFARLQTKKIHKRYVARVLTNAKKYMDSLPSLLRVSTPSTHQDPPSKITVVGDIHGDLYAMLHIFDTNGFPSLSHPYIFNGDVLDKGYRSIETLVSLLMIQLSCPQCIYITRGNHEDVTFLQSRVKKELQHLYGLDYFQLLLDVVNALPLAVLVNDAIFVVHGGIVNPNLTLDEISIHPRGIDVPASDSLITDYCYFVGNSDGSYNFSSLLFS
jgi:serine/threonine-protein phosphatase 5